MEFLEFSLCLAIAAFAGYFSLAIIACGAFEFILPKHDHRLGKIDKRSPDSLIKEVASLGSSRKGFWRPLRLYVFHPPRVSLLCISCTGTHEWADQKLFWMGPEILREAVVSGTFRTFCTKG